MRARAAADRTSGSVAAAASGALRNGAARYDSEPYLRDKKKSYMVTQVYGYDREDLTPALPEVGWQPAGWCAAEAQKCTTEYDGVKKALKMITPYHQAEIDECKRMLCNPFCLKGAIKCQVVQRGTGGPIADDAMTPQRQDAICAQVIAHICAEKAQCCPGQSSKKDELVFRWVEDHMYADGSYPQALLPIPRCQHDVGDPKAAAKTCKECKQQVEILVTADQRYCQQLEADNTGGGRPLPAADEPEEDTRSGNEASSAAAGGVTQADVVNNLAPYLRKIKDSDTGAPETFHGPHMTLYERCRFFQDKIRLNLKPWVAEINANIQDICECLGCCDKSASPEVGPCFYPFYQMV